MREWKPPTLKYFMLVENLKIYLKGLDRAHGVTKVTESISNGTKIKGKSFVKREPVTDELWQKSFRGQR